VLNPVFTDYDGFERNREVIMYPKDSLARVQDYTKNISQSIFSPGVLPSNKLLLKQRAGPRLHSQYKVHGHARQASYPIQKDERPRTHSSHTVTRRKLSAFAAMLTEE